MKFAFVNYKDFLCNALWLNFVQNKVILYHIQDFVAHYISFELDHKFLWTWFWSSLKMILNWCTTRECHWYVFNFPFQGSCTWLCRRESRLKLLKFWSEYSTTCHFWWKHNSTKWGSIARYWRDDCEQWTYWEVISLLLHQEIYFQDHGNIFPRTWKYEKYFLFHIKKGYSLQVVDIYADEWKYMDGGSGTKVEYLIVKMRTPMTMTMNIHLTMTMNILFCYDYVDANSYCKSGTPPCRMGLSPLGPLFICRFPSSSCTRFSIRNSAVFTQFWGPVTVTILETEEGGNC